MRRAAPILLATAAVAGCGNDPTRPPDVVTPEDPQGTRTVRAADGRIRFTAPANWPDLPRDRTRVAGIRSRTATVAVWRYRRTEPLPATASALREARTRLLERVRLRDPRFRLRSSRVTRRGGARAIEIVGRESIGGSPFDVRSAHLFSGGAEVVVDAYARPRDFARVDAGVFVPLLRSLRVGRRRA